MSARKNAHIFLELENFKQTYFGKGNNYSGNDHTVCYSMLGLVWYRQSRQNHKNIILNFKI